MLTLKTRLLLTTLAAALMVTACGGNGYGTSPTGDGYGTTTTPSPTPAANTVAATASLTFTPDTLHLNAGDSVTFAFGSVPHNAFFTPQAGAPADITGNNMNVSITRTFLTAGTYAYTCHIHPSMQGFVVVR